MAKRFNVSIPDALAERMEPFKNDLSLSALMQDAIERELTRLTMSDEDKALRDQFRKTAIHAWARRLPGLASAVSQYIEQFVDQAANDGNPAIFDLLRSLHCSVKEDEILETLMKRWRNSGLGDLETRQSSWRGLIADIGGGALTFSSGFIAFLEKEAQKGVYLLSERLYEKCTTGKILLNSDVSDTLSDPGNQGVYAFYYESLLSRVRSLMTEAEIAEYICDLDSFIVFEGEVV